MEWEEPYVSLSHLRERFSQIAPQAGVHPDTQTAFDALLGSSTVEGLMALPAEAWESVLVNDAYKPSMHKMYAKYLRGVTADFVLHIRRTPVPLSHMAHYHANVFAELQRRSCALSGVQPYGEAVQQALATHFGPGFELSPEMSERAMRHGVGSVTWECVMPVLQSAPSGGTTTGGESSGDEGAGISGGAGEEVEERWLCIGSGPVEAASHTETSVMQLVQAATIACQVHELRGQSCRSAAAPGHDPHTADPACLSASNGTGAACGTCLCRIELLASSLAHLGCVVDALNSGVSEHGVRVALFAGRRASDRLFLVLQNLVFARLVRGFMGTSSVYAATLLGMVWDRQGVPADERRIMLGHLVGTHAHEQSSIMQQLLAAWDALAGTCRAHFAHVAATPPPLNITSLLAHLLFLGANGGMAGATALPDTFTTDAFVAVAAAADVPPAFVEDMAAEHGEVVLPGAKCFDLFRMWRIDSGDYEANVRLVLNTWQERCQACVSAGTPPPPRPLFMHSNLGSVEEVLQVAHLPTDVRPSIVAFGSLADGFMPLDMHLGKGSTAGSAAGSNTSSGASVRMCSVVMKAVQARVRGVASEQVSAMKMGDGQGKLELDPRLCLEQRHAMAQLGRAMCSDGTPLDAACVSLKLAAAYDAVARDGILR